VNLNEKPQDIDSTDLEPESNEKPKGGSLWGWRIGSKAKRAQAARDPEKGGPSARPTRYFAPVYGGLVLALSTCKLLKSLLNHLFVPTGIPLVFIGSGVSVLLQEWRLTQDYTRFALLATAPCLFCVSLVSPRFHHVFSAHYLSAFRQFFSLQVITNVSYV
jgi:hypothetical protein